MELRAARPDDLERIADLVATRNRRATGIGGQWAAFLRRSWESPAFELERDTVLADAAGVLVGYGALTPAHDVALVTGDPALADRMFARLAARARERGDAHLGLTTIPGDATLEGFVARHGFRLQHETIAMGRALSTPIPPSEWPDGVVVRTFEPADAPTVQALLAGAYAWDASYVVRPLEEWTSWLLGDEEYDPSLVWLAERDGALVGCALHWTSGWLKDLAVVEAERGRGLGAALVHEGLTEFKRRGLTRVGLKVDVANPTGAQRLYERCGFVEEARERQWLLTL